MLLTTLTREFGLTGTADTIDIEVEPVFTETAQTETVNSLDDHRGGNLRGLPTDGADLMTVVVVAIVGLVFGRTLKAMAHHQTDLHQEIERVVERGPADREVILLYHLRLELIKGEEAFMAVDGTQDGITLRRLAMTSHLKIVIQNACDRLDYCLLHLIIHKNRTKVRIFRETKESLSIKNLNWPV